MKPPRFVASLLGIALSCLITGSAFASFPPGACTTDAECDDGSACTDDHCAGGACSSTPIKCIDGDACTLDGCNPQTGCTFDVFDCTDNNPCTKDTCDPQQGCLNVQINCEDNNACTDEFCDPQTGCNYIAVNCDDSDPCTVDSCDEFTGCAHALVNCDDGDACTEDFCNEQQGCQSVKVNCDDSDACTVDSCNTQTGCQYAPINCNDADLCTTDACDAETGCRFTRVNCDDEDVCTIDSCSKTTGCTYSVVECDDQNACTDDVCDPDTGCGSTPVVCDDHDACTVETCDAETGCESGPPVDCDDHDACTADSCDAEVGCVHTTLPSCAPPPDLDHFQCYESHRPPLNRKNTSLDDQFGASTVVVKRAKRLCAPANKNGEDPDAVDADGHLTAYTIKQSSPHFEGQSNITVVNQFGTTSVDLYRPERLLVPTSKSLTGPPGPLTQALDHFKCYRVRGARFRRKGVTVETQFGPETVDIKQPRHLCAPADKNDEDPDAPTHALHLMCYQVRARPQQPRSVFTLNQFGPDAYDIFGLRELCVPSFKNPGTCGDGTINAPGEVCERPGEICASDGRKCGSDCKCPAPTCGDGIKSGTEACDPAGSPCDADGRLCNSDCTCPAPVCGDKIVDVELGEECDDGNLNGSDGCGPTCLEERCIPSQEICDGADNNCDEQIDEGNPGGGAPCLTTAPGVCAAGTLTCKDGALVCEQNEPAGPEICDGKDNDCNGQIDEGNPGGGSPCLALAAGACSAGTLDCTGGALTCTPGTPSAEVCGDATDNDCDGVTDEFCCAPGEFTCGDGSCIPEAWVCDDESDCSDGSDEDFPNCQVAP